MQLIVEDSGKEAIRAAKCPNNGVGIGLKNTKERISVIYQDDYKFETMDSSLGGFKVEMKLPITAKEITDE